MCLRPEFESLREQLHRDPLPALKATLSEFKTEEMCHLELGSLSSGRSITSALATFGPSVATPRQFSSSFGPSTTSSSSASSGTKKEKRHVRCRYYHRQGHIIVECHKLHAEVFLHSQQRAPLQHQCLIQLLLPYQMRLSASRGFASLSMSSRPFLRTIAQLTRLL